MSVREAPVLIATLFIIFSVTNALADVSGRVVAVTDGDTIKVLDSSSREYKIRLTGIDAPERGQPFGKASTKHLAGMIAGKQVKIESNKNDRYGRMLGKVIFKGVDVNLEQVKAGYAWWYEYYAKQQPIPDRKSYSEAEKAARSKRIGLWADSNPINPYEWRKSNK